MVATMGVVVIPELEVEGIPEAEVEGIPEAEVEGILDPEVEGIQEPEVEEAVAGQGGIGNLGDIGQHAQEHVALVIRSGSDCVQAMTFEIVMAKPLS